MFEFSNCIGLSLSLSLVSTDFIVFIKTVFLVKLFFYDHTQDTDGGCRRGDEKES